jgi:hypothetical protein
MPDTSQTISANEEEGENNLSTSLSPKRDFVSKDVLQVIGFYVQELTEETSVPHEKPVCSVDLSDLTRADVKTLVGGREETKPGT